MNYQRVSPNLTFEQFKEYADRKPSLEGNWIYLLEHINLGEDIVYPEFKTISRKYYFHTFKDAENFIREILSDSIDACIDTYAFIITQLAVGEKRWSPRGASWLYDCEGTLIDCCTTTCEEDPYKSAFFGRSAERLRFKKGDIVEVINQDSVNLAVVAADGPSVEWFWGLYNRTKNKHDDYFADESDDCYYVIDGPGFSYHSHVPALALMKPLYPIPEDIRAFFEYCLEVADQEDCTDKYRCFDCPPDNIKDMAATEIKIRFDKSANRHILVKKISDYVTGDTTYIPITADETDIIDMLNEVRYGKTRLWYIIKDWNENDQDIGEPDLPLDTTIDELIKND